MREAKTKKRKNSYNNSIGCAFIDWNSHQPPYNKAFNLINRIQNSISPSCIHIHFLFCLFFAKFSFFLLFISYFYAHIHSSCSSVCLCFFFFKIRVWFLFFVQSNVCHEQKSIYKYANNSLSLICCYSSVIFCPQNSFCVQSYRRQIFQLNSSHLHGHICSMWIECSVWLFIMVCAKLMHWNGKHRFTILYMKFYHISELCDLFQHLAN